ncbi:MAG TPA: GGDEF domain-containing protein, partial [Micromonospora sp.]
RWLLGGTTGLVACFAFLPLPLPALHVLYLVAAALAIAVGFRGVRVHRPSHPRGWLLLLAGFSGWVVGDLVWKVQSWYAPPPFPDPSDAVYLASYGLLGAGVLAMVRTRRSGSDRAAFLDAAILTTGIAVLTAVFVIKPVGSNESLSTLAKVVASAYPVGDVFLLATLARMLTSPGSRSSSYRLLMAALLVTTVSDVTWNLLVAVSGDAAPDRRWINVGWLCGYVLVALAANRPAMALVAEPAPPSDVRPFGRRRVVAMAVGLLLPPAVLFVEGLDGEVTSWPMVAGGAAVMSVLVLLRFVDLFSVVQTQAVQLAALARTDALTGAANRRTWDHELSRACQFARDHHRRLSLAILDIDHFKSFNDTFGHQAGDELLQQAVAAWTAALPSGAFLARYGGEEFAVLLPDHGVHQAHAVITDLRVRTPLGQTFSAGVVERLDRDPHNPTALVAAADKALYRAKRGGRNQVLIATEKDLPAPVRESDGAEVLLPEAHR